MYLFMCVECMIKKKLIPQKGTAKERERERKGIPMCLEYSNRSETIIC